MKVQPTKDQLFESYIELKSLRKVGKYFGYTGEGIRNLMQKYNLPINKQKFYTCDRDFFSKDTEESFYVAGFIAADGCVYYKGNSKIPNILAISLASKDENHLYKIKKVLKSTNPINNWITKNHLRNENWNDSFKSGLRITSSKLCSDLKRFNIIPRKTFILEFPEWLTDHPLVHHFMRGYFDGDGGFVEHSGKNINQLYFNLRGTNSFLKSFKNILEKNCKEFIDKPQYKNIRISSGFPVLEFGGNRIVGDICEFLYKESTIKLDRKYNLACKVLNKSTETNNISTKV